MPRDERGASRAATPRVQAGEAAGAREEILAFLADLATALHASYLPAQAVEARIRAAARGLGVEAEAFTLQTLVLVGRREGGGAHLVRMEMSPHWNLGRLHDLVSLADAIAAGRSSVPAARAELERLRSSRPRWRKPVVVLAYAVYGAAVGGRVGGGATEVLVAGLVGLVAGAIHFGALARPTIELQKSFVATFVGALAAFVLSLVLPPFDASRAIFAAMTLLVPAVVITLAASEMASEEAIEAGVVRLSYGLFRFLMMGAGAVSAANVWSLLGGPAPETVAATALPLPAVAALLVVGGIALAPCLQARPRDVPWIVLAVLLAWGTQELTKVLLGGHAGPFAVALVLGIAAALYGRLPGKVPSTVLFPGLMQIAPGFLGTQAVLAAIHPGAAAGTESFFDVLVVAVQLVLGMMLASVLTRGREAPSGTAG